jgi:hypothetical protein
MSDVHLIPVEQAENWAHHVLECAGVGKRPPIHCLRTGAVESARRRHPWLNPAGRLCQPYSPHGIQTAEIVADTETSCVIDAGYHPVPVGAVLGLKRAIEKAKQHGMGMAVVRHSQPL